VSSGVADRRRLAIVGWSYGGYAALQAAVTAPDLFRAVVAVAPLTDLPKFKESYRYRSDFYIVRDYLGSGSELKDGSPARHASLLRAPILLVHGRSDGIVPFTQTEIMDKALLSAGIAHDVLTFDGLGHSLNDTEARTTLLRRSDAFIKRALDRPDGN
jgi:dipeptidyl aminopeptidase/acylaminoacyl peptidase